VLPQMDCQLIHSLTQSQAMNLPFLFILQNQIFNVAYFTHF
jgi:hypothetical protein